MGKQFSQITPAISKFIESQKIFFVATATNSGRINLSPKGMDSFRILSPNRVMWLNATGSGNETAAHISQNPRITVMFCAFEGKPNILRLYGAAKIYHPRDIEWNENIGLFPQLPDARQLIDIDVDLVQTSCGFAVPYMDFKSERNQLNTWAEKKGDDEMRNYWEEKNTKSLDGLETGIFD